MPILTAAHEKTNGCQYRDKHSVIQRQPSSGLAVCNRVIVVVNNVNQLINWHFK